MSCRPNCFLKGRTDWSGLLAAWLAACCFVVQPWPWRRTCVAARRASLLLAPVHYTAEQTDCSWSSHFHLGGYQLISIIWSLEPTSQCHRGPASCEHVWSAFLWELGPRDVCAAWTAVVKLTATLRGCSSLRFCPQGLSELPSLQWSVGFLHFSADTEGAQASSHPHSLPKEKMNTSIRVLWRDIYYQIDLLVQNTYEKYLSSWLCFYNQHLPLIYFHLVPQFSISSKIFG